MTGNRKALLIGINYLNAKPEQGRLNGCENDVKNMERYLTEHCSYDQSDIMVLTEDGEAQYQPTRKNMIAGMRWLTQGAQRHDALFFHYSGHGGQRPDGRGQTDEIYPVDFYYDSATRSFQQTLTARDLNNLLVVPLPAGCRLTTVIDACHSASALALPYSYDHAGEAVPSSGASGRPSPADVIEWAGCRDDQTSADADEGGQPQGAMTW
ncbi:peptidase C14 [Mycena maculata]|uniref:Peptidase C14 n=1 Tax=Mycena maculata TaxID=230809 RepID=A0AAD7HUG2_9AGAR|nr:peptidase C14 [Mycena maculata]